VDTKEDIIGTSVRSEGDGKSWRCTVVFGVGFVREYVFFEVGRNYGNVGLLII
jgi:hypothetical protein